MIWVNKLAPSCLVTYLQVTVISNKMRWNHRIFNCNVRGLLGVQTINESPPPTFYVKPQILGRVTFYFLDISYSTVPHFWAIWKYTPKRDVNKKCLLWPPTIENWAIIDSLSNFIFKSIRKNRKLVIFFSLGVESENLKKLNFFRLIFFETCNGTLILKFLFFQSL